jgi:allantoate deiminase
MAEYGLQPEEIAKHPRNDIKAFLEIHIEQGPVLENAGKDIGIVDNIVGIKRVMVTIRGRADHVGTMPMNMRKDALEAAAKVIADIGDVARKYPQAVATVGHLTVEPNIVNIIPDKVCFTVDFRGTTPTVIEAQYQELLTNLRNITARFGMDFDVLNTVDAAPVEMSAKFRDFVEASCIANRYSYMHLASGAGHDAGIFGTRMPAGMIFVPSMGGRSHCPEEKTDSRTLAMASLVAGDVLCKMDRERAL